MRAAAAAPELQGVPPHWTPGDLAKAQALYGIRHLENILVSSSHLQGGFFNSSPLNLAKSQALYKHDLDT